MSKRTCVLALIVAAVIVAAAVAAHQPRGRGGWMADLGRRIHGGR